MKKISSILFSTRLMAILFIVFAMAMGIATFIENDYDTETAKVLIYNAWWFEFILLFFIVNFLGNIVKYKLYKPKKWAVLTLHLAFIFIILGAGITRYISFEGKMPIRENETSNLFLTERTYVSIVIDNGKVQKTPYEKEILLSRLWGNNFSYKTDFQGTPISIKLIDYVANAKKEFIETKNGATFLKFVESSNGGRHDHYIKKGTSGLIHGVLVGFDAKTTNTIDFYTNENNELRIKTASNGTFLRMADRHRGKVVKDSLQSFNLLSLYNVAGLQFVVPTQPIKGKRQITSSKDTNLPHQLLFEIKTQGKSKKVTIEGSKFKITPPKEISVGDYNFRLSYGSKEKQLPFHIKLRDFELKNYPGSESPMSFASEVTVVSPKETFDYRIYMNHILNYKGYKFFQSSYNATPEYEETHLSVNHDFWGTTITYIGYNLLYLGLILVLFLNGSRFATLRKSLRKLKKSKALLILLFLSSFTGFSQQGHTPFSEKQLDSILHKFKVNPAHIEEFNKIIIQDEGGRMKPVHTYASELVRKVAKSETFRGMTATEVFISMQQNRPIWFSIPMIYIKKDNTRLRDIIGIPHDAKYAPLKVFFDRNGNYLLAKLQQDAFKKKIKNKFEESVINVDIRVNLMYSAIMGRLLKIFPIPNDGNHKWISENELHTVKMSGMDSIFVRQILPIYFGTLKKASETGDYSKANEFLNGIKKFQKKYGKSVYPEERKIELEIFYNEHDIFKNLFWQYMLAGVLLLIFVIIGIFFNQSKVLNILTKTAVFAVIFLFLYHTLGLGVRWYISGHAPWSNGYESMIYIAWATMLFGLFFGRKSQLTIAATAFVVSMALMFAHLNWLDPAIGNLVPVLNSYWLMIHVSIIVASYGPFTLSMILGLIALFIMAFTTKNNQKKLLPILKEITIINEMSMTVGLALLTIGNFLGAQWANESWGRYWGWDPKETWALISIMVYAFVIHARLIKAFNNRWALNVLSVFAYASILMTYLGVNHLLSGLHSYAKGESASIPMQIWIWLGISIVLTIFAFIKYRKFYKK
ncbi:MAG: cytochrome c biogenesis protein CcsA [Flavobacteriaceae bacterium]|nr:cytochrome c biogenesis protein CcsA [Flavobacteriaceae bacterium]